MKQISTCCSVWRITRLFLFIALLGGLAPSAQATHFRYGNISWTPVGSDPSGRTIQFRVSVGYRTSFGYSVPIAVGAVISNFDTFDFGDGTSAPLNFTVTSVNGPEDFFYAEAVVTRIYTSNGNFVAYYDGCCRISTLENNADEDYYVGTTVTVGNNNRAPVATLTPIVNLAAGLTAATFQIPASDPDGDGITFSLATSGDLGGIGFSQPANFLVSSNGFITFQTTGTSNNQLYNAVVKMTDSRGAITFLDFIIRISGAGNAPTFVYGGVTPNNGSTINAIVGTAVNFSVQATDTDPGDAVSVNGVGIPLGALFTPSSGTPTATSTFAFTPTAPGTFVITFTATDNSGGQAQSSVTIQASNPVSTTNVPPIAPSIPNQTGTVGVPYNQSIPPFTDPNPGQTITYTAAGLPSDLNFSGGSITGTPSVSGVFSVTITGTDVASGTLTGGLSAMAVFTITINPVGTQFQLVAPTYNCATGDFTFNTTGGDGSTITYWAIGITGQTTNPNDDVDTQLAQDIRDGKTNVAPITLYAQQSGVTVTYVWDALAACRSTTVTPPVNPTACGSDPSTVGQPLQLQTPTYSCSTGVIRFNVSGGNGSPVEFMAIGITGWTANCTDNLDPGNTDNNTYTIMARQGGVTVSLPWTRPCASLRIAREVTNTLEVNVLGNPTTDDRVVFEVRGAEGQALRLQVVESNGRAISDMQIEQAGAVERRTLSLGRAAGLYLIKASTDTAAKTVKVLKN